MRLIDADALEVFIKTVRQGLYEERIKPCPLCGKQVSLSSDGDYWEIRCDDCHLNVWFESKETLIEVWEYRVEEVK